MSGTSVIDWAKARSAEARPTLRGASLDEVDAYLAKRHDWAEEARREHPTHPEAMRLLRLHILFGGWIDNVNAEATPNTDKAQPRPERMP